MNRGDLYWADVAPRSGSEQSGRRPVVVVSDDSFNLTPSWRSIIVVPCTTSLSQARRLATIVEFPDGTLGLRRTVAVCHQVTTIDRLKFKKRIGALPLDLVNQVSEGIKAAMDLP